MLSLKKSIKTEFAKMRKMSFKDKCWYIKEYYSFQIFFILICSFVVFSLVGNLFKKQPIFSTFFINSHISSEKTDIIYDDFRQYSGMLENEDIWLLDNSLDIDVSNPDRIKGYEYLVKITAMIAAQDLDIIISDESLLEHYANIDILADLEEVLPNDLLETLKDDIVYKPNSEKIDGAYAINISNAPVLKDSLFNETPTYLTIISNSDALDNSILFLKYIYGL